mmetsp:Transcript_68781/g.135156  ORF Transcript_68781/g.135156 Transcript_68781/m.135156 type:complete len:266 (-) Transcript_68781:951-1748(-)
MSSSFFRAAARNATNLSTASAASSCLAMASLERKAASSVSSSSVLTLFLSACSSSLFSLPPPSSSSSSSFLGGGGGGGGSGGRSLAAEAFTNSGAIAAAFSVGDFSTRNFTSACTSALDDSSMSCQGVGGGGGWSFLFAGPPPACPSLLFARPPFKAPPRRCWPLVGPARATAPVLPSRRCTTLEAASTSSITKITSLNPSLMGTSSPCTQYRWSNMMSISSWLVVILAKGTFTMDRFVCCARALISEVFPVPGGPCSKRPSLCG